MNGTMAAIMSTKKTSSQPASGNDSAETLAERVKQAIANATTLQVVTSIGPVARDKDGNLDLVIGDDAKVMMTRYDLIDGDITTVMDPAYVDGPYQQVRDFHQKQVDTGLARVGQNIDTLKKIYDLARSMF